MSYQAYLMRGPKKSPDDALDVQACTLPEALDGVAVLVKVKAAGVCHSDVHLWHGYYQASRLFLMPGADVLINGKK